MKYIAIFDIENFEKQDIDLINGRTFGDFGSIRSMFDMPFQTITLSEFVALVNDDDLSFACSYIAHFDYIPTV